MKLTMSLEVIHSSINLSISLSMAGHDTKSNFPRKSLWLLPSGTQLENILLIYMRDGCLRSWNYTPQTNDSSLFVTIFAIGVLPLKVFKYLVYIGRIFDDLVQLYHK
jgi:hypothetical protein